MNPDDVVLVALLKNPRDFDLVAREHWYRIPAKHAPKYFSGAQVLAFYFTSSFGDARWTISWYAAVTGHELARRSDLLPEEGQDPHADDLYYKIELGPLQKREPPILSKRGRRILFLWTTWDKFLNASDINDLIDKGPRQDKLWDSLKSDNLDVERQVGLQEGRSRYRVDFMVYCPQGRLALFIGDSTTFIGRRDLIPYLISDDDLDNRFGTVVEEIRTRAQDLGVEYPEPERLNSEYIGR